MLYNSNKHKAIIFDFIQKLLSFDKKETIIEEVKNTVWTLNYEKTINNICEKLMLKSSNIQIDFVTLNEIKNTSSLKTKWCFYWICNWKNFRNKRN